jgi:AhpD family alkylhydroperoxidase
MNTLSFRDRELVALGAALASNCIPCVEHHVVEARNAGLSNAEITEAIRLADKIKQVPAGKVLDAAAKLLGEMSPDAAASCCAPSTKGKACC